MLNVFLRELPDPGGAIQTLLRQTGPDVVQVNRFLEEGISVRGGVTHVPGSAWDALADILLGVQLYNILNRRRPLVLHVEAAVSRRPVRYSPGVLETLVRKSREGGHLVEIRPSGGRDRYFCIGEGEDFMSTKDYDIQCPSFSAFLEEQAPRRISALDFAHPMDAGIIRILDNPAVNRVFSALVDLSVDAGYGLALSTGIRVDESDPEISSILNHCAGILGICVPYTVISSSVSGINAVTVGTDEFHYIAVGSLMKAVLEREEMQFVLGHECGHIALGHVLYHTVVNTFRNLSELLPAIGPAVYQATSWPLKAWSRRSEISADRAGLLCCGDIDVACRSLLKLEAGFMSVEGVAVDEYISNTNRHLKRAQLGRLQELLRDHPILSKRMEALRLFAGSEKYYRLSGREVPKGVSLLPDKELERETEKIVKVL